MKQDKRTSIKLALAGGFLSRWATPSILAISLPAHAQTTLCDPVDAISYDGFLPSNVQCVVGNPNRATFDLLNIGAPNLTFIGLDASEGTRVHISPPLPFDIANGETVSIVVESTLDSVANCPDLRVIHYLVENDDGCGGFVGIVLFP